MSTKKKIKETNEDLKIINWEIHNLHMQLYYANVCLTVEEESDLETELEELEYQRSLIISKLNSLELQHNIIIGCLIAVSILLIGVAFNYFVI
tara:strand:- start:1937 stop:2215 length:279 start_codon:yes stop_codon:yes gene_type:complete